MLGKHLPLAAWRNDNGGGCSVCRVGHCKPRRLSRLAVPDGDEHVREHVQ